jgi:hypothetical protein
MMMKRRGAITRVARQWRLNEVVRAQMLSALDRLTFRRERLRDSFFDILDLLRREPQLREPYFAFLRAGGNTSADFERFLSGESIGQGRSVPDRKGLILRLVWSADKPNIPPRGHKEAA